MMHCKLSSTTAYMINVTKTYLPELDEYVAYLKGIWERGQVTNNGPLVRELEEKICKLLGVSHLLYCGNGTVVLQLALKALNITQEVITTPFSYCATTTSLIWQDCKPVFADIDPATLCINPANIEALITSNTQAILATHVYGNPCDVVAIEQIAQQYNLKVIYDAAHAFGVSLSGNSLLNYGDVSTCSFHATKIFHTIEGGSVSTNNAELAQKLSLYRSFGHIYDDYLTVGINAKNSEFHAAMGLVLLPKLDAFITRRKILSELYDTSLNLNKLIKPTHNQAKVTYNYAYYPVIFETEEVLLRVKARLAEQQIFPRRYFYPSLNTLPYLPYTTPCPVSEDLARRILCLPLYYELSDADVLVIAELVNQSL